MARHIHAVVSSTSDPVITITVTLATYNESKCVITEFANIKALGFLCFNSSFLLENGRFIRFSNNRWGDKLMKVLQDSVATVMEVLQDLV